MTFKMFSRAGLLALLCGLFFAAAATAVPSVQGFAQTTAPATSEPAAPAAPAATVAAAAGLRCQDRSRIARRIPAIRPGC